MSSITGKQLGRRRPSSFAKVPAALCVFTKPVSLPPSPHLGPHFRNPFWQVMPLLQIPRKVFVAADADDAGRAFGAQVKHELKGLCEPIVIHPVKGKDFGDATVEEVRLWMSSEALAA